jgi:hypothetical protein
VNEPRIPTEKLAAREPKKARRPNKHGCQASREELELVEQITGADACAVCGEPSAEHAPER